MIKFEKFKALHESGKLFILPNAWDAESAIMLENSNYSAIGTSSAAVATVLGYPDGEVMPFDEYLIIIQRIAASVKIPVTVDMEMGYEKSPEGIYKNVQRLVEAGVVGINIEDSVIHDGKRSLKEMKEFASIIAFIKSKLKENRQHLFVNVRCDAYLLNVKAKELETTKRLKFYESVGADGIFLPFISDEDHIASAVASTKLPLNVMVIPNLPALGRLNELGVKRVSMGPFLQKKVYSKLKELATTIIDQESIQTII